MFVFALRLFMAGDMVKIKWMAYGLSAHVLIMERAVRSWVEVLGPPVMV